MLCDQQENELIPELEPVSSFPDQSLEMFLYIILRESYDHFPAVIQAPGFGTHNA